MSTKDPPPNAPKDAAAEAPGAATPSSLLESALDALESKSSLDDALESHQNRTRSVTSTKDEYAAAREAAQQARQRNAAREQEETLDKLFEAVELPTAPA